MPKRVVKGAGVGRISVETYDPGPLAPDQVRIRARASLISRGSELGDRYLRQEAVDPRRMGYSLAGEITEVGAEVAGLAVGQRVVAAQPHAEEVLVVPEGMQAVSIPDGVAYEDAAFAMLGKSVIQWVETAAPAYQETVVILGQGLVGNLMLQQLRVVSGARIIAVDGLKRRLELAGQLGAHHLVNINEMDPVEAVGQLTGNGADLVIDAVGGRAGIQAFRQAQQMVRTGGRLLEIGLYHGEPLPLDAGRLMHMQILGANHRLYGNPQRPYLVEALRRIAAGYLRTQPLITHRFPLTEAQEAFDLLYEHPDKALGVVFHYDP